MKRIAIIPARGGSKRLPRKNIISFLGRPIIDYTIQAAIETELFNRVVVSTEDDEIADIASKSGADVDKRRSELATDKATVVEVCLDLLYNETKMGNDYEIMCCLYATAPLRKTRDICSVVGLVGPDCDFAMAVAEYGSPPWQALKTVDNDRLEPMWPEWISTSSQNMPNLLVDNGSTYAVKTDAFMRQKTFYGFGLRGHLMPRLNSVDIDTAEDLSLALCFATMKESL